jgi:CHAD domain-containing protein
MPKEATARAPSSVRELVFVATGEVPQTALTDSLHALLNLRRRPFPRDRFTILDTFEGRIRRARARLTVRALNGASALAWEPDRGGRILAHLPSTPSFAWDLPDGPLQDQLAPVVGPRRLLAQADVEEHGSLLDLLDNRGKTVARVRITSGRVRQPGPSATWQPMPTTLTLTGMRGFENVFERVSALIETRPGVNVSPEDAQSLVLRLVSATPYGERSLPGAALAPTVGAEAGARLIHRSLLNAILENEPGVRANLDSEFLHDFRVALRRTRALLRQIRGVFPPAEAEQFLSEFSWIAGQTGPKRDLDVLALAIRGRRVELGASDVDGLLTLLQQAEQREHELLLRALDGRRYRALMSAWGSFLDSHVADHPDNPAAGRPLIEVVSRRAWRLSRRIAESAAEVDAQTSAGRLHKIRLDAKKLRYLIDVTPTFYDPADLKCVLGGLKKLQDALGDFNDAVGQETRLIEYGRSMGAADEQAGALLVLGRLAEETRQRSAGLRENVLAQLIRFAGRDIQHACRRAFKRARVPEALAG